jgi:hypothetical protein
VWIWVTDKYYEHIPEGDINVNGTTITSDLPVIRGRKIQAHRLDTVLYDKNEKTCLLIDIALPDDSKFNTKETEKLSKYKHLEIEISRMWKVKTKYAPDITGALGTIKEVSEQNLQLPAGYRRPQGYRSSQS